MEAPMRMGEKVMMLQKAVNLLRRFLLSVTRQMELNEPSMVLSKATAVMTRNKPPIMLKAAVFLANFWIFSTITSWKEAEAVGSRYCINRFWTVSGENLKRERMANEMAARGTMDNRVVYASEAAVCKQLSFTTSSKT
jgi:hypothetical protein